MATETVTGRIGALAVLLFGLGDHPEQVDVGRWKWSLRPQYPIAVWRDVNNWNRTVTIVPVHYTQVAIEYPNGTQSEWYDEESAAIDTALEWMEAHQ